VKVQSAVLALLVATSLVGCSGKANSPGDTAQGPQTQTIEISYDEFQAQKQLSRSVTLNVGDTLKVSLASNPSTGFQWAEKLLISEPKVLSQTGYQTVAPTANRPGAAGTEVWTLEAKSSGNSTVSSTYSRPWPGGEKDAWVFSANVTVN
jgi:inhibitor of cysteine peptidase